MDAYTNPVDANTLKPNTVYKITTPKSEFLGKYHGRNKNEQLHFFDQATNRLVVLDPTEHITAVYANQ